MPLTNPVTTARQKIVLIILGIIISLAFIELAFRIGGLVYLSALNTRNPLLSGKEYAYRILCLGESTTAEGGQYSYPRQLERILNERLAPLKIAVINKGAPGGDTNFIVKHLKENLDIFNPQIVIVTMGINDRVNNISISQEELTSCSLTLKNRIRKLVRSLSLYKFFHVLRSKLGDRAHLRQLYLERSLYFRGQNNYPQAEELLKQAVLLDPNDCEAYLELARYYEEVNNYRLAQEMFKKVMSLVPKGENEHLQVAWFLQEKERWSEAEQMFRATLAINPRSDAAYTGLGKCHLQYGRLVEAEEMFEKAMAIKPKDEDLYLDIAYEYNYQGYHDKAKEVVLRLLRANPGCNSAYELLGEIYSAQGKNMEAEEMFKRSLPINPAAGLSQKTKFAYVNYLMNLKSTDTYEPETQKNYRRLKDLVCQRGIQLVCVQYPGRRIKSLLSMFNSGQKVIFVDNEKLFNEAVNKTRYEDYFTDRFAGDFGHCTPEGNRLLADNIAEALIREYFSKKNE